MRASSLESPTPDERKVFEAVCRTWPRAEVSAEHCKAILPCGRYIAELCWEELEGAMFFTVSYHEAALREHEVVLDLMGGDFTACFPVGGAWAWDEVTKRLFLLRTPPIPNDGYTSQSA
jgi:hypothetical protein